MKVSQHSFKTIFTNQISKTGWYKLCNQLGNFFSHVLKLFLYWWLVPSGFKICRVKTLIIHPFKTLLKSIWWLNITKNMLGTLSYGCINPKWSTWIELWFISHSTSFIRLIVRWMNPESQCMQYWMILSIILPPYESSYSNGSCVHNMEKIY